MRGNIVAAGSRRLVVIAERHSREGGLQYTRLQHGYAFAARRSKVLVNRQGREGRHGKESEQEGGILLRPWRPWRLTKYFRRFLDTMHRIVDLPFRRHR